MTDNSFKQCSQCTTLATGYGIDYDTKEHLKFCDIHGHQAMAQWKITKFHRVAKAPRTR